MGKYSERIADKSVWLTATPPQTTLALPFYITEAGHFYAEPDYKVSREQHDSYLFLYTLSGCGKILSDNAAAMLPVGSAVIIDCHKSHSYASCADGWEFLWIHIKGSSVKVFFDMLYSGEIFAINISTQRDFAAKTKELISKIGENDILSAALLSSRMHDLFCMLIADSIKTEQEKSRGRYSEYVERVIDRIHNDYSRVITIDNIISDIPISKFHFIRVFKRIMGTTPYNYLTNYRINSAKFFLRTTDMPVAEVADKCGFSDTSNFIVQFKKHTGQSPLRYRRYFTID